MAAPVDPLDHYRDVVERTVDECDAHVPEEELERFFFHVITCFEQTMSAEACANAWVAGCLSRGQPAPSCGAARGRIPCP